jgi:hypothetical protein
MMAMMNFIHAPFSCPHIPGDLPAERVKQGACQIRIFPDSTVYGIEKGRMAVICARILGNDVALPNF